MRARWEVMVVVVATVLGVGCSKKKQDDATLQKELVGVWSFPAHAQLLPEKSIWIEAETPIEMVLDLGPAHDDGHGAATGRWVEYRRLPKTDTRPERWARSNDGMWMVVDGELSLDGLHTTWDGIAVRSVGARELSLVGAPFSCKPACVLTRVDGVPAEARDAGPI